MIELIPIPQEALIERWMPDLNWLEMERLYSLSRRFKPALSEDALHSVLLSTANAKTLTDLAFKHNRFDLMNRYRPNLDYFHERTHLMRKDDLYRYFSRPVSMYGITKLPRMRIWMRPPFSSSRCHPSSRFHTSVMQAVYQTRVHTLTR